MPFSLDKAILAGSSGSFAFCLFSALAGCHEDEDVIYLARSAVNTPSPAMKAESVVWGEKGAVLKNPGVFYRCTKDANVDPAEVAKNGRILIPPESRLTFLLETVALWAFKVSRGVLKLKMLRFQKVMI